MTENLEMVLTLAGSAAFLLGWAAVVLVRSLRAD
jgi:hypothetical protein